MCIRDSLRTRLFGFENWTSVINECLKRYCSGQLNAELAVSIHMNWVLEQERGLCSVEDYMLPARVFSDMWERIQSRDLASPLKFMVSGKLSLLPNMACLLYTSDAADEEDSGDLGGCRII
eukprot:TRINITY_DN24463_c0_g1_i1.p1 TRINITY_DN24463_c0_g1~~TRINITY_DN24463_c0_g1_i1.p1  ORF type:complete len:121 (+),score=15.63 TRINITY_DN24463_c0_g1_i1:80-442(+)